MTTFPLTVAVTPTALQVKPGASAQVTVTITNVSDIVEHYQVTLVGLPSNEYWATEPAMTKLKPRGTGTIGVRITIPERGGLLGGRYVLGVLVSSPYQPDVARSADLVLEVGVVSGMEMTATPMTAYGKTEAAYAVSLTNEGNIDVPVDLVATDDLGKAEIVINPPSVYVRPRGAQVAQVYVRAPGLLTGKERRSTITIKALAAGETCGQVQVGFIQTPRIAPVVFRTLGIVLAVAVIAAAIVIGNLLGKNNAPPENDRSENPVTPTPSAPNTPSGNTTTPPAKPTVSPITVSPSAPVVGADTVLSATASAGITTWLWDITGPDNFSKKLDTPQQVIVQFPAPGTFTVKLAVTDTAGEKAEAPELTIEVESNTPGAEIISTKLEIAPGQTVSNAARCSEGLLAVGGGFDVVSDGAVPPPTVLQAAIGTGGNGGLTQWTATVLNPSGNTVDGAIKAVCVRAPDGYEVVTNTDVLVDPGTSGVQQATCGDGLVALGGGGGIRSDTVMDTQSVLEESMPVLDGNGEWTGWQVRARNIGGSAQPLSVQVVCAAEPQGYEVVEEPQTEVAGNGQPIQRQPTCPDGTVALSGGIGVVEEIPRDPATETILRESTMQAAPQGTQQQWMSHLEFSAPVDQVVTGFAICANPPG